MANMVRKSLSKGEIEFDSVYESDDTIKSDLCISMNFLTTRMVESRRVADTSIIDNLIQTRRTLDDIRYNIQEHIARNPWILEMDQIELDDESRCLEMDHENLKETLFTLLHANDCTDVECEKKGCIDAQNYWVGIMLASDDVAFQNFIEGESLGREFRDYCRKCNFILKIVASNVE